MKYRLQLSLKLLLLLSANFIYSQTTHQYTWGMSSTNQQITINAGDTVVWTWGGGTHNLRSTGGVESFDSGYFNGPGPTFSYTFNTPGVTTYICDPHPNSMYGAVTVTGTASVQEESKFNFRISPNPASNIINLSFDNIVNEDITIEIYDLLGRMNRSVISNTKNGKINLDISELSRGIYIAKVKSGVSISIKRFIKD